MGLLATLIVLASAVDEMEMPYNAHRPILRSASLFPAGTSPFAVSKQTSITADPR